MPVLLLSGTSVRLARRGAGAGRKPAGAAEALSGWPMRAYLVNVRVDNIRNNEAALIEPIALASKEIAGQPRLDCRRNARRAMTWPEAIAFRDYRSTKAP